MGATTILLLLAVAFGLYMAWNIGANDVANNVGPAVGSKAAGRLCGRAAFTPGIASADAK